jgi:cohesin loading factor subunit SCC2
MLQIQTGLAKDCNSRSRKSEILLTLQISRLSRSIAYAPARSNLCSHFKTSPKFSDRTSKRLPKMSLSPLAQQLYDQHSPEYSYPSPETPTVPKPAKKPDSQKLKPSISTSVHLPKAAVNQAAHNDNSTITVHMSTSKSKPQALTPSKLTPGRSSQLVEIPARLPKEQSRAKSQTTVSTPATSTLQHMKPSQTPQTPISKAISQPNPNETPSRSNLEISVVIPDPRSTIRREEYESIAYVSSPDTPQHLSKKRDVDGYDGDVTMTHDQRQKADGTLRGLQDYLERIFEVGDELQPDAMVSNRFFLETNDGIGLNSATQKTIETLLKDTIDLGRFSRVSLDDLLRLQKLCENALKDAENVDIKVDETMGESEVDNLVRNISIAELGLKSARTSLRLMTGSREEKQLYSEDAIQGALNSLKNVIETCIIPVVEMRSTGSSAASFKLLAAEKKAINNILIHAKRLLSLLATIVAKVELSETVVNTLEFTASRLVFVENAHTEKDSILGIAKFDNLRVVAMEVLSEIFLAHPLQRRGIFDEILTSLEKLPVTKQSARQFKLAEGGSIQLVSALIMRLVQISSSKPDNSKSLRSAALANINADEDELNLSNGGTSNTTGRRITSEARAEREVSTAIQELAGDVELLVEAATDNARYVVQFIVKRAMNSTKTGDAPYRNLLDLFVDDFITCLKSPDWPAAELLLRLLMAKMIQLAEGDKVPTPAKNMALDLLGSMGAAISELVSHVRKTAATLENDGSDLGKYLSRLAEVCLDKKAASADLVSWACGPFRVSLEFLNERRSSDPQLNSAIGYYMVDWASRVVTTYARKDEDEEDEVQKDQEYGKLAFRLSMMITDKRWLSTEYSFDSVTAAHARLAHNLTLLSSRFCESFGRVLTILLQSMTSEQATVRSKSLKSVNQVLETDPSILDREPAVKTLLLRCASDQSVQVRDSALGLIGKCITLRPSLETEMIPSILQRINDTGVGVRKRCMKLSKDIYLRNLDPDIRSSIADCLLHRVTDPDESVREVARQTIEEVWMSPFYRPIPSDSTSAELKLGMANHVALMVKTVQRGGGVALVLDKVLQNMLSEDSKNMAANFRVCKALVAIMFDTLIDNSANAGKDSPSARDALQVLMIFAKSNAKLFTPQQIQLLQPYVANVGVSDDLVVYRDVVVIFRHVLPHLPTGYNNFLVSVRRELFQALARMSKVIQDDMIASIWIISKALGDFTQLTRAVMSTVNSIQKNTHVSMNDLTARRKVDKFLLLAGMFGKNCDLEPQIQQFKTAFPAAKTVSKLLTDSLVPFAASSQPLEVRKSAFEAIGMVCQSWPKNFENANILGLILEVFADRTTSLEVIILKAFKEYMLLEEKRSDAGADDGVGVAAEGTAKLGVMGGGQGDGIVLALAGRYLEDITRIALATQDDQALLATELIASIARQGLRHPKECAIPLMALETSQNPKISDLAYRVHRTLHEKHETSLEMEYMRGVRDAFEYQRDVIRDIHGATLNPFSPKLGKMIDVLKISKLKTRKKFFKDLCSETDFDQKMSLRELLEHLEYAKFIIENLAFFEYQSVDELLGTIGSMENVAASTGTSIAHAIETEILHINLDQPLQIDENGQSRFVVPEVDPSRLQHLTASSMMLSCLWQARTYLRRQYGLMTNKREGKAKAAIKDLSKAPVKASGINGDKFWESVSSVMSAHESTESMMAQCRSFVDLLNVDPDFKIAAEGDDARLNTPSEEEDNGTPGPPGSGGRKRKGGGTPGGRKKRARSSSVSRGRSRPKGSEKRAGFDVDEDDEDGF